MKMKKRTGLLMLALALSLTTACGDKEVKEEEPIETVEESVEEEKDSSKEYIEDHGLKIYEDHIEFTDGLGHEVSVKKNPEKVVVLYNSYLELWMQNGGEVIGRLEESKTQGVIPGTEDAEIVGGGNDISVEKILSLEPDLIIMSSKNKSQGETISFWEDNDITYMSLDYDGLDDYHMLVRLFTELNGREDLYEENSVKVQEDIDAILAKVPEKDLSALLMGVGRSIGARDSSFWVGEIIQDLGVRNIADDNSQLDKTELSKEVLLQEDPDFILTLMMNNEDDVKEKVKEELSSDPAWDSLTAIKEDKLYFLEKELLWFRPNNRYAESYEYLAKIFYPEVFGELGE